jgi:hypothetical protein
MPSNVYLYEGTQHPDSSIKESGSRLPSPYSSEQESAKKNVAPYYSITDNQLTIYNLKPNTSYWVCFERLGEYFPYGLFDMFEFICRPSPSEYQFTTFN